MTEQQLCRTLSIERLPDGYGELLARFTRERPETIDDCALTQEEMDELVARRFLSPDALPDVADGLDRVRASASLSFAFGFLIRAILVYRKPWDFHFYADPAPQSLAEKRYIFPFLVLLKVMIASVHDLQKRGLSDDEMQLKGLSECGRGEPWGMRGMFHWNISCALGKMFYRGALRFELERMPEGYRCFRRRSDGRLLVIWSGDRWFDGEGQFTSDDEEAVFHTENVPSEREGWLIRPDGAVVDRRVILDEREWDWVFGQGDLSLSYHIPPKIAYTPDTLRESFSSALKFFDELYPEITVRGIQSYSWLYSPQLPHMLPPESGIVRLNRLCYLAPVPSGPDGFYEFVFHLGGEAFSPESAPRETSLQRGFSDYVRRGGKVHNGFFFLPRDGVPHFGEPAERRYCWDLFRAGI